MRSDEARLAALFKRLVWLSSAVVPAALYACSPSAGDPSADASIPDGSFPADATATSDGNVDAGDPRCAPISFDGAAIEDGGCADFVRLPCGLPEDAALRGCFPGLDLCLQLCPTPQFFNCGLPYVSCVDGGILPDADIILECTRCPGGVGRKPEGFTPVRAPRSANAVGRYLAEIAQLEAASVHAFEALAAQLDKLGAPQRLVLAAKRAARDEVRHTRLTGSLARRHGVRPPATHVAPAARETVEEVAIENIAEGCVRETFGALIATWQAAHARDPQIARTMQAIAKDETRHAALSWRIARWAASRLDRVARARVRARLDAEVDALRSERFALPREALVATGLPSVEVHRVLVEKLASELWA